MHTTRIFEEGRTYIAHALELDVSSCGSTKEEAGTLQQILEEAG
jgi:hypothetical protein